MALVVSDLAEQGIIRINRDLASFRQRLGAALPFNSRLAVRPLGLGDSAAQDAFLRMIASVEYFATGLLFVVVQLKHVRWGWTPQKVASVTRMGAGTWSQRRTAWNEAGVDLATFPQDLAFQGFIEGRNSIAHGLGQLTWRQTRTPSEHERTLEILGAAGLRVAGNELALTPSNVEACGKIGKDFINWVDQCV